MAYGRRSSGGTKYPKGTTVIIIGGGKASGRAAPTRAPAKRKRRADRSEYWR